MSCGPRGAVGEVGGSRRVRANVAAAPGGDVSRQDRDVGRGLGDRERDVGRSLERSAETEVALLDRNVAPEFRTAITASTASVSSAASATARPRNASACAAARAGFVPRVERCAGRNRRDRSRRSP